MPHSGVLTALWFWTWAIKAKWHNPRVHGSHSQVLLNLSIVSPRPQLDETNDGLSPAWLGSDLTNPCMSRVVREQRHRQPQSEFAESYTKPPTGWSHAVRVSFVPLEGAWRRQEQIRKSPGSRWHPAKPPAWAYNRRALCVNLLLEGINDAWLTRIP